MPRWRRAVFGACAGISAFMLAYVAFTHVLAFSRRKSPDVQDIREGFGAADALPAGYAARVTGGMRSSVHAGVIAVEGSGKAGDGVTFALPARRFDDAAITLRFRVLTKSPVDVSVGLERDGGRAVAATYLPGDPPVVNLGGDVSGPTRAVLASEETLIEEANDAGPDAWHTLALQFSPRAYALGAFLDGRPVESAASGLLSGADMRVTFGVKLRGDASDVRVEIDSLTIAQLDWANLPSFDETFNGEFVDPLRWMFRFPDPELGKFDVRNVRGGLSLSARALTLNATHVPFFLMRTPPFFLKDVHVTADIEIQELDDASVFFGIFGASAWTSADRIFDVGIAHREEPTANAYAAGAWTGTGHISFDAGPKLDLPRRVTIELAYEARTGRGRAWLDGKLLADHPLDLRPLDLVALRLGSDGYTPASKSKLLVRRIAVEMR